MKNKKIKQFLKGCVLRSIDLNLLFVIGFAFFISCFNEDYGSKYSLFLMLGGLWLMATNSWEAIKKDKKE